MSRDLALMGALTGRVSLLIKKVLLGVGRIDPLAGVVLVAHGVRVVNLSWMRWSPHYTTSKCVTVSTALLMRGVKCIQNIGGGSGGSM